MALSKKYLAPLALSFAVASAPAFAESEPSNVINSQPSFSCAAPTVSSLANLNDRFEEIEAPATVLIKTNSGSTGSGFIVDPSGIVVTNDHVVDGATNISVTLYDANEIERVGERYTATLVGTDDVLDVAVLRIDNPDGPLPCVKFGDSDAVGYGDSVNAFGNPFGQVFSLSQGIISHPNRELGNTYYSYFQTDTAINSGNSGGPLFNEEGQVIGINNAIISPQPSALSTPFGPIPYNVPAKNAGIGISIHSNDAAEVVDEILQHGSAQRAALGVALFGVTEASASSLGVEAGEGVVLKEIDPGSVAERHGLQKDDVILSINGVPVSKAKEAIRAIAAIEPDETAVFSIIRDGQALELELDFSVIDRDTQKEFSDVARADSNYPLARPQCRPGAESVLADNLKKQYGEVHVESGAREDGILSLYADIEGDGIGTDNGSWTIVGHPYKDQSDPSKGANENVTCVLGSGYGYPDSILDLEWYKEQFTDAASPTQQNFAPEAETNALPAEPVFEQPGMH